MDIVKQKIIDNRNLKESSVKTYLFNLNKLHKKIFDKPIENLDFLLDVDKVIDALADLKLSTQKTYYASIVVSMDAMKEKKFEKALDKYREIMLDNIKDYNEDIKKQNKSETQSKNWISMKALKKVVNDYYKELKNKKVFEKSKDEITKKEKDLLQKWLVGSLYVIDNKNPPLRLDYTPLEIISLKDYNKLKDNKNKNYLVNVSRNNKFFSFSDYKTDKTYGIKKIPVGNKLNSVLNSYLKLHDNKFLLLNNKGEPMTSNSLGKYITKVFEPTNKKITGTLIRHIYISEFLTGPSLQEKENLSELMHHNVNTQQLYRKK